MTRNLKVLGLAFAAVLAMSAVAASVASAQTQFHSDLNETTLTGTQGGIDKFITTAGTVECKVVSYHGLVTTSTTKEVTITPTYGDPHCTAFGLTGQIHMNECDYLLKVDPGNTNVTTGTVDIVCPAGKEITVTGGVPTAKCIVHVPAQTGLGTVTFTNSTDPGSGKSALHADIHITDGIKYTHTKGTGLGSCPSGSSTEGDYEGTAIVTGEAPGSSTKTNIFVG